jgi:metal-responsive CopG/Arc/MetJ family transcriptional regulator
MASPKIAITIPEDILEAVDAAARERGQSRSGFISRVLRAAMRSRRNWDITRRLDSLFLEDSVAAEQRRVAAEMESVGTDWSDEAW